jgi:uncharacterized cupin superfamily protein
MNVTAICLSSSAPHIRPASDWASGDTGNATIRRDHRSRPECLVLHLDPAGQIEIGIRRWYPGCQEVGFASDELCYFMSGDAVFRSAKGEQIKVSPETAVHFKEGWSGEVDVGRTLDASYMRCAGGSAEQTPVLRNVRNAAPLKDWGPVVSPLAGESRTAGILLSREPDMRAESGIWTCTPGEWRCVLRSDEFCHFLEGSSTYTHDSGEVIEIKPDTLAYFPRGWQGRCEVHETVRKVYMIR